MPPASAGSSRSSNGVRATRVMRPSSAPRCAACQSASRTSRTCGPIWTERCASSSADRSRGPFAGPCPHAMLPAGGVSMTTMRAALDKAMGQGSADGALTALQQDGIAMADIDTMSQAIHDVYCGIMADHQHPNDKDREQARRLIDALG